MKTVFVSVVAALALSAFVVAPSVMAQQPSSGDLPSGESTKDAQSKCMDMMQSSRMTDEGKKAMQDFMRSTKAPEAMNNMMEMARRMGDGDPMLGMTKMMEMMGGQASPDMHQPK